MTRDDARETVRTTLRWEPPPACTAARRLELMGPGASFELAESVVLGTHHDVFVHRFPHLRALFDDGTTRHAEKPYLVHADRTVTFADARRLVATTAAALQEEHGIGRGDRVAIAAANRYEYVIVVWAVIAVGGVVVGLNGWWTGAELEYGLRLAEPKLLVADGPRLARLHGLLSDLPRRDFDEACPTWFDGDAPLDRPGR